MNVERVAIERPDGVLIERLLDAGLRVLALHPNQVAATRSRFRASGGKSDRFDAFVLCELARTDHHRFHVLEPDSDATKALRALTRAREDLVHTKVALTHQLRAELERFWPGPIGLFTNLDSRISLAFLVRYPSPIDARGLGEQRLRAFLERQRYRGGKTPATLLAKLRRAPQGRAGAAEMNARRAVVLAHVSALTLLVCQIKTLEDQIATAIREHPDGEIFLSLFRQPSSVICAATLLSEIGDCRARYPTAAALAADARQSAVAIESGKRKIGSYRWRCHHRLRFAFGTPSDTTRHWHPWAADHYARARTRGHDTNARSAPSAAPGPASSGAAGKTTPRMTPPATAACNATSPSRSRRRRAHCLTSPPPSVTATNPTPDTAEFAAPDSEPPDR